jgi:hypothetical protein
MDRRELHDRILCRDQDQYQRSEEEHLPNFLEYFRTTMMDKLNKEKLNLVNSYLSAVLTKEIETANMLKRTISNVEEMLSFYEAASHPELEAQFRMFSDWKGEEGEEGSGGR